MTDRYILDEQGEPVPCPSLTEWGRWFDDPSHRRVCRTQVGPLLVSTVFLGLDHGWNGGPPVLWETMVFDETGAIGDGEGDEYQERYTTRADALAGHERAVAWASAHLAGVRR